MGVSAPARTASLGGAQGLSLIACLGGEGEVLTGGDGGGRQGKQTRDRGAKHFGGREKRTGASTRGLPPVARGPEKGRLMKDNEGEDRMAKFFKAKKKRKDKRSRKKLLDSDGEGNEGEEYEGVEKGRDSLESSYRTLTHLGTTTCTSTSHMKRKYHLHYHLYIHLWKDLTNHSQIHL